MVIFAFGKESPDRVVHVANGLVRTSRLSELVSKDSARRAKKIHADWEKGPLSAIKRSLQ